MTQIDDMTRAIEHARLLRETLLADPHRPTYHFAIPEDMGIPGDPNGAFYANGRYHLMYLYACRSDGFRWGHLSSHDLVHWRVHPDAIVPDALDGGIFSGGAFVDDDGTCYLTYWSLPGDGKSQGGIRIIKSHDRHYDTWEKFDVYALACTESAVLETVDTHGEPRYLGCADPSNIWKNGWPVLPADRQSGRTHQVQAFRRAECLRRGTGEDTGSPLHYRRLGGFIHESGFTIMALRASFLHPRCR